jgi:transcriptional regulator with XRE-family HTH domain
MDTTAQTLGTGLKAAREGRNLSLRQVEEATGISNAYISQLENEKVKKPSPHFLHKLAMLYDVPYDLLMEYAGYIKRTATGPGPRTLAGAALHSQAQLSAAGAALYSQAQLTDDEAAQLLDYLGYIRSKNKTK